MDNDIYVLPDMQISQEEDSAFTAAEALIDYLGAYRIRVSGGTLERHLRYLGVTEAQLPALFDFAGTRGVVTDREQPPRSEPEDARVRALGALLLTRMEQEEMVLRAHERELLELRFGLRDGVPRTLEETAQIMGVSRERVRTLESRTYRRCAHRCRRAKKIRDFYA